MVYNDDDDGDDSILGMLVSLRISVGSRLFCNS